MGKHLLLTGFSCTGKTSMGRAAFQGAVIDSDDKILEWVASNTRQEFEHIYQIYMECGRPRAIELIEHAESALIARWAEDTTPKVVSLGPGFPFRENWVRLRLMGHVVLFQRPPEVIYDRLKKRREEIFEECPDAKRHDNWDVHVMVDEHRNEYPRHEAVRRIAQQLVDREEFYRDNDAELCTDDSEQAKNQLQAIWARING